jgi:hypothetical protein
MAASETKVMRWKDKSRSIRWIVSGAAASALAMFGTGIGCMGAAPVTTSNIELDVVNSCNASDSSHTIAAAVTCAYNVASSANDGAAITAGPPRKSCGKWVVDCYLSGIKCSGSRTKKPLTCPPPEYLATNQDVNCPAMWASDLKGFQGTVEAAEDDSILSQPTAERAARLCSNQYGNLLTDLNATANNMCNAVATTWTNESKKSAVCCIPAPKLDAGVATMPTLVACIPEDGAGCGSSVSLDASVPDASTPGDGGGSCSIVDPSLGDEPVPL